MKKSYLKPRLTTYGDVGDLTRVMGDPGAGDTGFDASGDVVQFSNSSNSTSSDLSPG